jgi:hypothetical protein
MVLSMATLVPNSGWARGTTGSQSQAPAWNGGGAGVTKDGSQMTVVGNGLDRNVPIVDVTNNSKLKKKAPPSFWSRLTHPSQWFGGGSKAKK